jgi:hypothetical protein
MTWTAARRVAPWLALPLTALFAACSDDLPCDPTCVGGASCVEGQCVGPDASAPDTGGLTTDVGVDAGRADDARPSEPDAEPLADAADAAAADADPPDLGPPPPVVINLVVTPTSARLTSTNGDRPSAAFAFALVWSDGTMTATTGLPADVDPLILGSWEPMGGRFTSNGRVGGAGRVLVRADGGRVGTSIPIQVQLEEVILDPGTSTTAPDLFAAPGVTDPARRAELLYPLEGAVMPQNVAPAVLQWDRAAPGDVFRIRVDKPNVRIRAYTAYVAGQDGWQVPLAAWRRIAQSEPDAFADIIVDRYEAATQQVILGSPVRVKFARAALLGSIYYWDIAAGRILRIQDGTATRDAFMPTPPQNCVGCHSVSPSGRWMAGRYGGGENWGGVVDLTQNLTGNPPPQRFAVGGTRWWFSSWSPDESRMIVSYEEQGPSPQLRLIDPATGAYVTPGGSGLPTGLVSHPAWSPDGAEIAYVGELNAWGGQNSTGSLFVVPVTGPDTFGAPTRIVQGTQVPSQPGFVSSNYPTWTPDAARLAFAQGNGSRSESAASELWMVDRDGSNLVRLGRASDAPEGYLSYQPRFSPFTQGGYQWMSFLSRRHYGNPRLGTRGAFRQQIWVSAIKENPLPGEDPSEVPYWLPGQDVRSMNISAYWAPRACRAEQESCDVDAECCTGECAAASSGGAGVCVPMSGMCRRVGEPCRESGQCCGGVLCIDGICGAE